MPERRWLRIIPVAFIMYTIAFIDRTNISLAIPSMSRDLHMDPAQAGDAAGIFFWGYLLLQIPGGYLAHRWSAKKFISILLVLWGFAAVACGLVTTWRQFWVMRFLLGVAEGGVWPAVLVMLSHWFPRAERARANAYWMLCTPVAVVISSPLSGWILGRWDWRVLLVAEGALPFVWLLVWNWFINDHPHQAQWISPQEREYLETALRKEAAELEPVKREPHLQTLFRPQVLIMVLVYFLLNTGAYGYLFWLPSALGQARSFSSLVIGILYAIPYLIAGVAMVLISQHSDKTRERRHHVAFALAWGGMCILLGAVSSQLSLVVSFLFLFLANAGTFGALGPFWAIPTETLPRHAAGTAMGLINAVGNLGGYFGPLLVGYLNKHTGNFQYAFGLLSLSLLVGAALALLLVSTRPTTLPEPARK
jgi:sugar phosphate permease